VTGGLISHLLNGVRASADHTPTPDTRPETRAAVLGGFATILLTFGGLGTWAMTARLDSAVMASGVVVVETNRRDVQHLDGGIVSELLAREGSVVTAGDTLLRLDPTRPQAALAIIQGQMDGAKGLKARLQAELEDLEAIAFPPELMARRDVTSVRELMVGQAVIFAARQGALRGQVSILRQRIAQLQEQIVGLQAQERARERQIQLIQDELQGIRHLYERGLAPRTRLLALERELARLLGEQGEHLASMARTSQAVGETELQILHALTTAREESAKALQEIQNRILELQERLIAAEDVMRRTEIRAPVNGTVVGLETHTVGGVVQPGRTIMQIVPTLEVLTVEAQVNALDVDGLSPGMATTVTFPGFPQRSLPILTGVLVHVSADRFVEERTGAPYFKVRLVLDEESLEQVAARRIVPGMPVEITIATGSRTALRYLIDPIAAALSHAMRER
jgi:HlyD family type I secretion membrane fusion protein